MTKTNVSRRSLTQGAAWAVPALTVATAAPALAASPVPSVAGASSFIDTYQDNLFSADTIDAAVKSGQPTTCGYTVTNGPASVTNISVTYWLPAPNFVFTPTASTPWSTLTRDASKASIVGPSTGITYYAYTTTYAGTGSTSTTCGPQYSFTAPAVTTTTTNPGGAYYFQLTYTLNGTTKSNPLRSINNP